MHKSNISVVVVEEKFQTCIGLVSPSPLLLLCKMLLRDDSWDIRKSNLKKQPTEVQPKLLPSKVPATCSSHPPVDAHLSVHNAELSALPCLTTGAVTEASQLVDVAEPGQAIPQDAQLSDVVVEP